MRLTMKKNNLIIILFFFFYLKGFSQTVKDTVYIFFDSTNVGMRKSSFKDKRVIRKDKKTSFVYYIDEKKVESSYLYDSGYTFWHSNRPDRDLIKWGGKLPLEVKKDTCFLKKIDPLEINFFLETKYRKVCKTFEDENSREEGVIIFIIDKDEIRDGKIVLREVKFSRPVKE